MARPLRIEYPGAFYHVINRGNAGCEIYTTRRDREKFLEYLAAAVERFNLQVHTYCLMGNHYHLLVETADANLSAAIQWLNVSYAVYFNRKRSRLGHLFQGRFKSILVDADEYLKQLSRYIHLNPLRAQMVDRLVDHEWSSYPAFIGDQKRPEWLNTKWLLSQFAKKSGVAKSRYREFVERVDPENLEDPSRDLVSGLILGNAGFVDWVKNTYLSSKMDDSEVPQLKELKPRVPIEVIANEVARAFGSGRETLLEKGRKRNIVRDVAIYLTKRISAEKGVDIARFYGLKSSAAVQMRYACICRKMEDDRELKKQIKRIHREIINI